MERPVARVKVLVVVQHAPEEGVFGAGRDECLLRAPQRGLNAVVTDGPSRELDFLEFGLGVGGVTGVLEAWRYGLRA